MNMSNSGLDLIILLLSEISNNQIISKLKFHKLLFLLINEGGAEDIEEIISFKPYKLGPWSPELDPLLQLMEDEKIIEITNIKTDVENWYKDHENNSLKKYELTEIGIKIGHELKKIHENRLKGINYIISKYSHWNNETLLRYVYTHYTGFKEKSIIKDKVSKLSIEEEYRLTFPNDEIDENLFSLVGIIKPMSLEEEKQVIDKLVLGGN